MFDGEGGGRKCFFLPILFEIQNVAPSHPLLNFDALSPYGEKKVSTSTLWRKKKIKSLRHKKSLRIERTPKAEKKKRQFSGNENRLYREEMVICLWRIQVSWGDLHSVMYRILLAPSNAFTDKDVLLTLESRPQCLN